MNFKEVISWMEAHANPEVVLNKQKKFGVVAESSLGIYHKDLNVLARQVGYDDDLATQLFDSEIYEGKLLCSKIFNPANLTEELSEHWIKTFNNWEICDSFSMTVFARSPLAIGKIFEWSTRVPEYEKRAAFATMAAYCMADKHASNEVFEGFLPLIESASSDNRLYVKKAVDWALRSIGKRNQDLRLVAIELAERLLDKGGSAKWIANQTLKELQKPELRVSDYPRDIYRKHT
jgi:3-methyladenine DNA glycosylase AlkD